MEVVVEVGDTWRDAQRGSTHPRTRIRKRSYDTCTHAHTLARSLARSLARAHAKRMVLPAACESLCLPIVTKQRTSPVRERVGGMGRLRVGMWRHSQSDSVFRLLQFAARSGLVELKHVGGFGHLSWGRDGRKRGANSGGRGVGCGGRAMIREDRVSREWIGSG